MIVDHEKKYRPLLWPVLGKSYLVKFKKSVRKLVVDKINYSRIEEFTFVYLTLICKKKTGLDAPWLAQGVWRRTIHHQSSHAVDIILLLKKKAFFHHYQMWWRRHVLVLHTNSCRLMSKKERVELIVSNKRLVAKTMMMQACC